MTAQTQNPQYVINDLAEFINRRMRDVASSINCCLIGEVLAIQTSNQYPTVTVGVNFQKVVKGVLPIPGLIGGLGDQVLNYPNLVQVPLFILQGGGAALTMPVQARVTSGGQITSYGDMCLILFCDRDIDTWFQTGQVTPPNSERVHNINDAIALVGIQSILKTISNWNPSIASLSDKTGERLTQSGMMVAYGGSSAPSGWLLCQGQEVSRTTYSLLFAVIGTTYGIGDGSNTFNVPNMQGQVAVGLKSGDPHFGALGNEFGEESHVLTDSELPADLYYGQLIATLQSGADFGRGLYDALAGGGLGHNNIQPSLVVNWIIKI